MESKSAVNSPAPPSADAPAVRSSRPSDRGFIGHLLSAWTWRMAWRDSRASRGRLLLFSCSIVLGIAALTAIGSLGQNLESAIKEQAKSLLGADLSVNSRQSFPPEAEQMIREIGGEQSREISFSTMIYFPRSEGTRLVQARALDGGFPYYGQLETEPASAAQDFRRGGGALVEESLLTQFDARVGETIRLGGLDTRILGSLKKVPGESIAFSTIAPRVYVSLDALKKTGLLREGSLAQYKVYFKFPPGTDVERMVSQFQPQFDKLRIRHSTVEERKRDLGRSMENLYHFLNLVGFVSLLLGAIGVASAIQVHVRQKLGTVAILRCLGGSISQTFAIYLAQAMALGLAGDLLGAALGIGIQRGLPKILADFIPFAFGFSTSWWGVARAMLIGFSICLLFALLPLLTVRRVSPLAALRISFEPAGSGRDPLRWLVITGLAAGVLGFAIAQGRNIRVGAGFALGLGVAWLILGATAKLMVYLARKFVPPSLPFVWRQGLANLHRPNNRTVLLVFSLGLGTFLMLSLYLVQRTLLTQLVSEGGSGQSNTILFDIQPDQREPIVKLVQSLGLPVQDQAPIVTMRIASVRGRSVQSLLADRQNRVPHWSLRHEYRCTYNDHLRNAEKLIAGTWYPQVTNNPAEVPISVEEGVAKELQVGLGDEIDFDVQGVPIKTRVASLREVDWRRIQPNFFVIFPRGVLEDAPAMHVVVLRVPTVDESAKLQRAVVKQFPNVSIIDLRLILQTLDAILAKISFVVRFMALFTVLTGLLVLVGAVLTGRYQRIGESVLLRTLGASRSQIFRILTAEYLSLGLLSAFTGIVLAIAATWALANFVFHSHFSIELQPIWMVLLAVPALTIVVGLLMSRGVMNHPPLAILRSEV